MFFSEDEAPPGAQLDGTLRRALLRSRTLVVIANRGTLQDPRWVRKEVEEFRAHRSHRPVIPINVGGALQDPRLTATTQDWLGYQDKIWLDEFEDASVTGIASDDVVTRLAMAPARVKANTRWRWTVGAVLVALLISTLGALTAAWEANQQLHQARARQLAAESKSAPEFRRRPRATPRDRGISERETAHRRIGGSRRVRSIWLAAHQPERSAQQGPMRGLQRRRQAGRRRER